MALTSEGKRLTEAHRLEQIRLGAQGALVAGALWRELDVSNLDASSPSWLLANTVLVDSYFDQSATVAARYVPAYRQAEVGVRGGAVAAEWNAAATQGVLMLAGPIRVKSLIRDGVAPMEAHRRAGSAFVGIMRKQILAGGRDTVANSGRADQRAIGYRRVTDGDPCTFCAMLASRGPAYGSKAVVRARGSDGMRYHSHCGCTAEIVYGKWEPTADEQDYLNAYKSAREDLRAAGHPATANNIVRQMRNEGSFRDSPVNRNQ